MDLLPCGRFDEVSGTPYPLLFMMLDHAAMAGQLWDRLLTPGQRMVVADGMGLEPGRARAVAAGRAATGGPARSGVPEALAAGVDTVVAAVDGPGP